jgi:hypothetical protein
MFQRSTIFGIHNTKARSLRRFISFGRLATVVAWIVFDMYLNVSSSFREDRPTFMIMSCHTNAMQKGNVIQNQDLNFVYNYSKGGFPSPSQSATGGNLWCSTNVSPSPLSRRPSTCQRFPAASPRCIKRNSNQSPFHIVLQRLLDF